MIVLGEETEQVDLLRCLCCVCVYMCECLPSASRRGLSLSQVCARRAAVAKVGSKLLDIVLVETDLPKPLRHSPPGQVCPLGWDVRRRHVPRCTSWVRFVTWDYALVCQTTGGRVITESGNSHMVGDSPAEGRDSRVGRGGVVRAFASREIAMRVRQAQPAASRRGRACW